MKKRRCTHQCMAVRRTGGQCTRLAQLVEGNHHHVIVDDDHLKGACLCKQHFGPVFERRLHQPGGAKTRYGVCVQEQEAA